MGNLFFVSHLPLYSLSRCAFLGRTGLSVRARTREWFISLLEPGLYSLYLLPRVLSSFFSARFSRDFLFSIFFFSFPKVLAYASGRLFFSSILIAAASLECDGDAPRGIVATVSNAILEVARERERRTDEEEPWMVEVVPSLPRGARRSFLRSFLATPRGEYPSSARTGITIKQFHSETSESSADIFCTEKSRGFWS